MRRDISIFKRVKNGCIKEINKEFLLFTGGRASSNGVKLQ